MNYLLPDPESRWPLRGHGGGVASFARGRVPGRVKVRSFRLESITNGKSDDYFMWRLVRRNGWKFL